ncbi:hypothetical protein C8R44DRAFT_834807 [Mycena epipterygia]|nr:hypothetical protein C8R44DRAFT_834807 [Mycena epipterygia]
MRGVDARRDYDPHTVALLAPGGMGSKIAARLSASGAGTILTNLEGRSDPTLQAAARQGGGHAACVVCGDRRARNVRLQRRTPQGRARVAEAIADAYKAANTQRQIIFGDCNAVNPDSAKRMARLFDGTGVKFIDGAIVGAPPSDTYNPGIYVSAEQQDSAALDEFVLLSKKFGLNVFPLTGEGAGVGDASALKMAHAGIVKGATGLFVTMLLSANASSPATSSGLLHALSLSQPVFVDLIIRMIPQMIPKAYRFIKEMDEIAGFVDGAASTGAGAVSERTQRGEGRTFEGLESVFMRVAKAHKEAPTEAGGDIDVLLKFVEQARETWRSNLIRFCIAINLNIRVHVHVFHSRIIDERI